MPTAAWRTGPLALCEVQGYVYAAQTRRPRASRARSVKRRAPSRWSKPRRRCRRDSTPRSGARTSRPMRWRSTATNNLAACALRTRAIACTPASRMPSARARSSPGWATSTFLGLGCALGGGEELRYNPMSYHNGSVWPHDNALLAAGAARYDDKAFALRILNAQFEAARHFDLHAPAGAVLRLQAQGPRGAAAISRSPVRRNPARRAPRSCCCRACSASASMRSIARSCWRTRWCRMASTRSA